MDSSIIDNSIKMTFIPNSNNFNMGMFNQNNIGFNMINNNMNNNMLMNNNMNMGMVNPNNLGFNMINNNVNNNMFMMNNIFDNNQINMLGNNNLFNQNNFANIQVQKVNINRKYKNKLIKGFGTKANIDFKNNNGSTTHIDADFGTTIQELLTTFLKLKGMFYLNHNYIIFLYNANRLNINDKRSVDNVSSGSILIKISYYINQNLSYKNFFFEAKSGVTLDLFFEVDKTLEELFDAYFIEVEKLDPFRNNINFIYKGEIINNKKKEIIKNVFQECDCNISVIDI